ncbi:uncharacterized protein LOC109833587 isoform X2 [Asparagus officinalis]|uniref:uncharacterized protein LOC109833587 isoform X2 n=1 Tax=Asparagus officinalis TaxID=4686 RepID=UPI00098E0994|nr:uncharacterized protein LOC109833587 isoform X2 [Asparagus officinalis]
MATESREALEEFIADLRTTKIKATYLNRRYQFLKSFVPWLEHCLSGMLVEDGERSESAPFFQVNGPAAEELIDSIHEARKQLHRLEEKARSKIAEIPYSPPWGTEKDDFQDYEYKTWEIVNMAEKTQADTMDGIRNKCNESQECKMVLPHLLLLFQDSYRTFNNILCQVRARNASRMKHMCMEEEPQKSRVCLIIIQSGIHFLHCRRKYEKLHEKAYDLECVPLYLQVIRGDACSQLSEFEDKFDYLVYQALHYISRLQETGGELFVIRMSENNYELLTSIVEARLNMYDARHELQKDLQRNVVQSFLSWKRDQVSEHTKNHPIHESQLIKQALEIYRKGQVEIIQKEKEKVEAIEDILRGHEERPGFQEARRYLLAFKEEYYAVIAEELRRVKLWLQVKYREDLPKLENQVEDEIMEIKSDSFMQKDKDGCLEVQEELDLQVSEEAAAIILKSLDGQLELSSSTAEIVAKQSFKIWHMLKMNEKVVKIPVGKKILRMAIIYCKKHGEAKSFAFDYFVDDCGHFCPDDHPEEFTANLTIDEGFEQWDSEMLLKNADKATIFELVTAAEHLYIQGLLDLVGRAAADMVIWKSGEEICEKFHLKFDFTQEELEEADEENESMGGVSMRKVNMDGLRDMADYLTSSLS